MKKSMVNNEKLHYLWWIQLIYIVHNVLRTQYIMHKSLNICQHEYLFNKQMLDNNSPLSHSSESDISAIFVLVMSLCDARNNTTSLFSFLIGTISSKHQNGVPVDKILYIQISIRIAYWIYILFIGWLIHIFYIT